MAKVPAKRAAPAARTKAATIKPLVLKGTGVGATDADIISATIADASAGRTTNTQQEWYCYEKHPWVRACIRLIANAVAQETFAVAALEGANFEPLDAESDPRVDEINTFFRAAFNGRSMRSMLSALVTDVEVFSFAYWRIHTKGDLVWYERLDPRLIKPVLNQERTEIVQYILKRAKDLGGVGVQLTIDSTAGAETIDADEVIRFATEGGDAVFGGPSLMESLDLTVAMDLSIRQHRNAFFKNGATHGTYILLPEATEEQAKTFERALIARKVGALKAYAPIVIAGQNADVKRFADAGKQEIDFVKGTELARDEIAAVFNVPLGKLLFSSGALGSAGKSEDDDTFQRDCVLPLEEMIYETLTREILLKQFEIDDLALIPRRRASVRIELFAAAKALITFGGTGNEARDLVRLPKMDDETMDEPLFVDSVNDPTAPPPVAPTAPGAGKPGSSGAVEGANASQQAADKKEQVATKKAASGPFSVTSDYWTTRISARSRSTNRV